MAISDIEKLELTLTQVNHLILAQTEPMLKDSQLKTESSVPRSNQTDHPQEESDSRSPFIGENLNLFMKDVDKGLAKTWPEMGIGPGLLTAKDELRLSQLYEFGEWFHNFQQTHSDLQMSEQAQALKDYNNHYNLENRLRAGHLLADKNYRLAIKFSRPYLGRGLPLMDVIQSGNEGLLRAIEKYNWRKRLRFSTYATWWVRQAAGRSIADGARTIRLPVHVTEDLNKLRRITNRLYDDLQRSPEEEELAAEMRITKDKIMLLKRSRSYPISLALPIGKDQDGTIGDLIADDNATVEPQVDTTFLQEEVKAIVDSLTERESRVIALRYGLGDNRPRTLEEVGREFGVTRERIRQIEATALRKLRHPSRARKLRNYYEDLT